MIFFFLVFVLNKIRAATWGQEMKNRGLLKAQTPASAFDTWFYIYTRPTKTMAPSLKDSHMDFEPWKKKKKEKMFAFNSFAPLE